MQLETLVTNIKRPELGIGCIVKKLKVTYKVNFEMNKFMVCKPTELRIVDTADTVTITKKEFNDRRNSKTSTLNTCIVGNEIFDFFNGKWVSKGTVGLKDLKLYPRVKLH